MNLFSENPLMLAFIANVAFSLEIGAVLIISHSILTAVMRYLRGFFKHGQTEICISNFKHAVGRGVQVSLELLIAADIINTVVLDANHLQCAGAGHSGAHPHLPELDAGA